MDPRCTTRQAKRSGKAWPAVLLLGGLAACQTNRPEPPSRPVASPGGEGGRVSATRGGESPGGTAGTEVPASLRCDRCGAEQHCHDELEACQDDADCATLLACVSSEERCGLDVGGAACVVGCARVVCAHPGAVALYRELDACLFCGEGCRASCSEYCGELEREGSVCSLAGGAGGGFAAGGASGATAGGAAGRATAGSEGGLPAGGRATAGGPAGGAGGAAGACGAPAEGGERAAAEASGALAGGVGGQ